MWGDLHFYGKAGVNFYTHPKTITSMWKEDDAVYDSKVLQLLRWCLSTHWLPTLAVQGTVLESYHFLSDKPAGCKGKLRRWRWCAHAQEDLTARRGSR